MIRAPHAPGAFSAERLARIREIEGWHFWFAGRQALLDRLWQVHLRGNLDVLDVGCGTGRVSCGLAERGHRVVALDMRPEGLSALRHGQPAIKVVQARAPELPLADASFDAAVLLDVLEHVDDRRLVNEVGRVLRPGGHLVLTVPALPGLWSYRDEAAGHYRRYTRASLRGVLGEAGLVVREMRYYQCLLLPVVLATRLLGRRGPALRDAEERPGRLVNALLAAVNRFEVRVGRRVAWPWGSSIAAVCRKR